MAGMIGRMAGAAIGAMMSKENHTDPVKGALIGAATMFVASRLLPARIAGIGATLAAGYIAKKFADRELARQEGHEQVVANVGPANRRTVRRAQRAQGARNAADRTVPPVNRSTKVPQGEPSNETA